MPIQSGQVGRYGIKSTPDILGPHKGIPWRSPALSNAAPTINGRTHDSTGAILGNCTVWAMSTQSDSIMGTTTSDSDGLFSLTLYTSGSFYLVSTGTVTSFSSAIPAQLSLSRASSGTYFSSSGVLSTASSNTARFDSNPSTLALLGLLVEESRTNVVPTNDFTAGSLFNVGVGATVTSLDGTSNAYPVTPSIVNGKHFVANSGGLLPSTTNSTTFSLYVKANGYSQVGIVETNATFAAAVFSLASGGSVSGTFNSSPITVSKTSIVDVGGGWFRISCMMDTGGANFGYFFGVYVFDGGWTNGTNPSSYNWTPNGTSGIIASLWQAEVGTSVSSYIYTTGAAATRSADILSSTDATLLAAKGWIVEAGEMQASTAATLLGINTIIGIGASSGNALTTTDGGTQTTGNTGTWTSQNRGGLAFDSTPRVSIALDGGTVVTAGNAPTTPTNLYFGNTNNGASGFLNGHLRMIAAYSAISDGQLPGISTVGASLTSVLTPTFSVQWVGAPSAVSGTTVNTLIPT